MSETHDPRGTSAALAAARVFWMMIGPFAAGFCALSIAREGGGWLTTADIVYLVLVSAILLVRWLEFRSGRGETGDGRPLTREGVLRFAALAAGIGMLVWIVANIVGNHL